MKPPNFSFSALSPHLGAYIADIPNTTGVYVLFPERGSPHLGSTHFLRKRLQRQLDSSDINCNSLSIPKNRWVAVEAWVCHSRLERALTLYRRAKELFPNTYRKRLKLSTPAFLTLLIRDEFPRIAIRKRIPKRNQPVFGPFLNREAAESARDAVWSLFQVRRCQERLSPSPDHEGCVYGEMNLCLRPCQQVVSRDEYTREVQRVQEFLELNGRSQLTQLLAARERASNDLHFEEAARLHKLIELTKNAMASRDAAIEEVHQLSGIAVTAGETERHVMCWPMVQGNWQPPVVLHFPIEGSVQSMDQMVRTAVNGAYEAPESNEDRTEALAIFSRWYYSKWRDGNWFSGKTPQELNYRKIVKEISRLVQERTAQKQGGRG